MKITLTTFLTFFWLNVFAQIPANGLIAHFPFTNNANDASGNGNNGIVTGASLVDDRFGNTDCAYYFPNSNDNISIPTITQTNVLTYSISGWFKKNSTSINNEGTVFSGSNPLITPGLRFHIGSDNQAAWGVETDSGSVWSYSQNQNYADDNWHFFTIIFNANLGVVDSSELIT